MTAKQSAPLHRALALATLISLSVSSHAGAHRSAAEKLAFKREHPCPSTGQRRGACPGFVIDHHVALCVGGEDHRDNMRWMRADLAKEKDKWECRSSWRERLAACEASGAC